ncbi:anacyclamide/piricyclamide family prenylated cyclic peptide [Planktothrix agardhii]|uniref:anacyclamide/piricyclamide family prenylated cyclic peptide n=1 Tax=Planktothrix agardhii TaxID=1160 RepID=UPI0028747201|nr:anacyclamide/piricyclamide family prenylated cyclic peptide [Planktothrix agardhii]MDS1345163.1 anacyclamide/piricyclamide family prenylated cyclic peptide [Planktothrix agardhii NRERC-751]
MTKKNLKPQQAAPVQREIYTTSSMGRDGAIAPSAPSPAWIWDEFGKNKIWIGR